MIRSAWRRQADGSVRWSFTIPPNATADVVIPTGYTTTGAAGRYGSGSYELRLTPTGPRPDPLLSVTVAPKNPPPRAKTVEIVKAEWGWFPEDGAKPICIDVADKLRARVKDGLLVENASNGLFGDAVPNKVKEVRGVCRVDGKEQMFRVVEDDELILPAEAALLLKPNWHLVRDAAGMVAVEAYCAVTGAYTTVSGKIVPLDLAGKVR